MKISKKDELIARKDRILGITVDQYIKTITPVSSSFIANEFGLDLSSATIRNILAELEEEGFLTHPHTSAGRVPTQKGYRYYVDHLMDQINLLEDEKWRIKEEYIRDRFELDRLLEKVSHTLSRATHYTSIVSIDGEDRIYCQGTNFIVSYPDYNDLKKIQSILRALDEKERLLKIINKDLEKRIDIYIGHELACREIDSCSLVISKYETKRGSSGRLAVLGPTRMDYGRVVSTVDFIRQLMEEIDERG
jgi:heat-inducible transcriptional repressor